MKKIKKRRKILLVDCSHILYVCYFGLAEVDRTTTNIIGKFLGRVLQLVKENYTIDLVFCWDSPRSLRKERYSFYKEGRKKKGLDDPNIENLHEAKNDLHAILPALGFNASVEVNGYEADDTMCEMVKRYPSIDFIIIANDSDLFQILRYSNLKGIFSCRENKLTTKHEFMQEWGVHPRVWNLYKALGGCASDEVPGIPGIGKGYAIKFLRGELAEDCSAMEKIYDDRCTIFPRNFWLVNLPLPGLKKHKFVILPNKVTKKKIATVSTAYKIYFSKEWRQAIRRSK